MGLKALFLGDNNFLELLKKGKLNLIFPLFHCIILKSRLFSPFYL